MKLKKFLIVLLFPITCFSSGIPTVDVAAIANTLKMIQEAKNQLVELKTQVETAKNQLSSFKEEALNAKKRLEGISNFETLFDSSVAFMDTIAKNNEIVLDKTMIDNVLKDFNLEYKSSNLVANFYDNQVKAIKKSENNIALLSSQAKKLDKLREKFNSATLPNEKEEIANVLLQEQAKLEVAMQSIKQQKELEKSMEKLKEKSLEYEYFNKMSSNKNNDRKTSFTIKY